MSVEEVEPQTAAVVDLKALLSASMANLECSILFRGRGKEEMEAPQKSRPKVLSDMDEAGQMHHVATLLGALTQAEKEGRMNAIWRAALL
jgi:hypothetical protein